MSLPQRMARSNPIMVPIAPSIFCVFFLVSFDVACRVRADIDVVHHPEQQRVDAVYDLLFEHQLHELLYGRRHVSEALTEGHHGKPMVSREP